MRYLPNFYKSLEMGELIYSVTKCGYFNGRVYSLKYEQTTNADKEKVYRIEVKIEIVRKENRIDVFCLNQDSFICRSLENLQEELSYEYKKCKEVINELPT